MAKILLDISPATGHYNNAIKLAIVLKESGHEIVFIGPPDFEELILSNGFYFYRFSPFIFMPTYKIGSFIENIFNCIYKTRLNEAILNIEKLDILIKKIAPDLVLVDEHIALKAIAYKIMDIKFMFIQTMPDPKKSKNIPPINSSYVPNNDKISSIICFFALD